MRNPVSCLRSQLLARAAVVTLLAASTAACSSDASRFSESPFSNPFSGASSSRPAPEPTYTGTVRSAPTSRIERAPLAAPSATQSRPMRGFEGGGTYRSSAADPITTGALPTPSRPTTARPMTARAASGSNWSAEGGSTVTLGQGETVHTLSQRYGVPASAIMQANNLDSASSVGTGSRLVIPVYSVGAGRVAAAPSAPAAAPARMAASAPSRPTAGGVHVVEPGQTLSSVARQYGTTRGALADANGLTPDAMVRIGQRLSVPGAGDAQIAAAPRQTQAPVAGRMQLVSGPQAKAAEPVKPGAAPAAQKTAAAPALKPSVQTNPQAFAGAQPKPSAAPEPNDNVKTASVKVDPAPEAAPPSGPSFRWPVRGRVISNFGSKASGSTNDGINLAVPEGTEVKASDDGVVAYSGSELKGFGNLVLIRHPNGYVTAYAHNSALNVKRGETIRRGQIIAKSGSTGSVTSPQLHFEVRKGASPVDPMDHLPGV